MVTAPTYLSQEIQSQTLAQAPCPHVDMERKQQMREAWKAYRGDFQKPLKVRGDQPDDNVISNRCAPIVDKGVSFLFGQVLKIECTDETSEPDTAKQEYLNGVWGDDDDRMTLLAQMAINGGVCGQPYVKIIPAQDGMKYPRLVVMDPLLIRMVTLPDDCSLHLAYIIEYPAANDLQKRQIIARVDTGKNLALLGNEDILDTWTISNYVRRQGGNTWMQIGEEEIWPYPFPPIFTNQNLPNPNEAWGIPDLTPDLINQNKVLNFIQSNTSRIIKFHGHPKTYATGLSASQINIGVDELICLPSPDSKLQNLEMQSDLASSLNFASVIRSDMDEQSRVPAVALGRLMDMPHGDVSGIALALMFQPLLEKTTQKRRLYGRLIREISRAALVLGGLLSLEEYENYPITLHWMDLLPSDKLKEVQTSILLKQLGISDYTLQSALGYNPEEELEKSQAEDARKMEAYTRGQAMTDPEQTMMRRIRMEEEENAE